MRKTLGIALGLSVLANAVLLYRVLDLGSATTDEAVEIRHERAQLGAIQKLLPLLPPSVSREDLVNAAREAGLDIFDKGTEGLLVGTVLFTLSEGRVVAVKFE
jgi:hypothetical protein